MVNVEQQPKFGTVGTNGDDPFDLEKLRLKQNFLEETPVKKLLTTVPVRKPGPQDFIRVHDRPSYRTLVALLELKDDGETYVVDLETLSELRDECFVAVLYTAITRHQWPHERLAHECSNRGRTGNEVLGPHQGQHELASVRNFSSRETKHHP